MPGKQLLKLSGALVALVAFTLAARAEQIRLAVTVPVVVGETNGVGSQSALASHGQAALRVALMDFSTDDNSYRSIQLAADFTSLVQSQLGEIAGVEWVERTQLQLARSELALAEMAGAGGAAALQRGRMLGANWLVKGHFATDEQDRPTLALQIIDLEHADVIASDTVVLPVAGDGGGWFSGKQAEAAVGALRQLLMNGKSNTALTTNEARVAFLFLADVSTSRLGHKTVLEQEFHEALKREGVTNVRLRLIEFPKAYQSTDESEMKVDGIIEAGSESWKRSADLYVWGTYAVTNSRVGSRVETKLNLALNLWDGVSQPSVVNESLDLASFRDIAAEPVSALIHRLVKRIAETARIQTSETESAAVRRQIADSIVKAYVGKYGGMEQPGLNGEEALSQAVQMLETACYFDPDNADARVLWLTCRYGWWVDFGHNVQSEFWTKWRRSQAWGDFVERFGLKPAKVDLPFPYNMSGIPIAYLKSSEDVIKLCPQNFEESEDESNGPMEEAQAQGFPKEISNSMAAEWKSKLEADHWNRMTKVVEFTKSGGWITPDKRPPTLLTDVIWRIVYGDQAPAARLTLLEDLWPECVKAAQEFGRQRILGVGDKLAGSISDLCAQAGKPEKAKLLLGMLPQPKVLAGTNSIAGHPIDEQRPLTNKIEAAGSAISPAIENPSARLVTSPSAVEALQTPQPLPTNSVTIPAWVHDHKRLDSITRRLFRLYPPNILPHDLKPETLKIQFPSRYHVQVVNQLAERQGQLWILAMEELSSPSSDSKPDLANETLNERNRIWLIEAGSVKPTLYKSGSFPANVNSFLFSDDQLWLAGDTVSVWDMKKQKLRKFSLADGLAIKGVKALTQAGGLVLAAGGEYEIAAYDPATTRWSPVDRPLGGLAHGTTIPFLLAGNQNTLGYSAGRTYFRDFSTGLWTNPPAVAGARCFVADGPMFWLGSDSGLQFYDTQTQTVHSWNAPTFIESCMRGDFYIHNLQVGSPTVMQRHLDFLDSQLRRQLRTLEIQRRQVRAARLQGNEIVDPLSMNSRIPGKIRALANEGDFLWIGTHNFFGSQLLLLHKPSHSLVAGLAMEVRNEISSLAVSDKHIWVGTSYGDNNLLRFAKDVFLSVPKSEWKDITLTTDERATLLKGMSTRDQALYAFRAGDDERVVELLSGLDPQKAGLEEMLLLVWSCDALGVDDPQKAETWCHHIRARYPDSPWARTALESVNGNQTLLAKFDRNRDQKLDSSERSVMLQDEEAWNLHPKPDKKIEMIMSHVFKICDKDGDQKLNREEAIEFSSTIGNYIELFDNIYRRMQRVDTNRDSYIDASEFSKLSNEIMRDANK